MNIETRQEETAKTLAAMEEAKESKFGLIQISPRRYAIIERAGTSGRIVQGKHVAYMNYNFVEGCESMLWAKAWRCIIDFRIAEQERAEK